MATPADVYRKPQIVKSAEPVPAEAPGFGATFAERSKRRQAAERKALRPAEAEDKAVKAPQSKGR